MIWLLDSPIFGGGGGKPVPTSRTMILFVQSDPGWRPPCSLAIGLQLGYVDVTLFRSEPF